MYLVTVFNARTQQGTTTSQTGLYTIFAEPGDPVIFSSIGYKTTQRPKPPAVLVATMNITMEPASSELKEFTLRAGHLSKYQTDSIENRAIYKRTLLRKPPSPFNSPVSAIAEKFSKKAKMAYQFQQNFYAGETEKFIDTRYSPEMVGNLTGLTGDSIGHFMYAYPMPYDFAREATDLEVKMWVRNNYKQWVKGQLADTTKK